MHLCCWIPTYFRRRCCNPSKNTKQPPSSSSSSSSWPPTLASERVSLTQKDFSHDATGYVVAPSSKVTQINTSLDKGNEVKVLMTCPKLSKMILTQHEDNHNNICPLKKNQHQINERHNNNDSKELACSISSQSDNGPHQNCCLLQKPSKPSPLLRHALTNANGSDWSRQRPLVARALATKQSRQMAAQEATSQAIHVLDSKIKNMSISDNNINGVTVVMDVRDFALQVAARAMTVAVLGRIVGNNDETASLVHDKDDSTCHPNNDSIMSLAELSLKGLFHPSLLPVRGGENAAIHTKNLNEAVTRIASMKSEKDSNSNKNSVAKKDCLLVNLLMMENDSLSATTSSARSLSSSLSRLEVIANAHSALLAGTQTISTTIAGALMHMAEHQDDCGLDETPNWKHGRTITMETIRLLPPVASLPRVPTVSDLNLPKNLQHPIGKADQHTIKCGDLLLVDLLAFAHPKNYDWKWCPPAAAALSSPMKKVEKQDWEKCHANSKTASRRITATKTAAPWGIGQRQCPAGALSIECISSILEGLVNTGFRWKLPRGEKIEPTDTNASSIPSCNGHSGWINDVHYKPTLCYPYPLLIEFSKRNLDASL